MLGWVAAVSATESPSQLEPGVDPQDVDDRSRPEGLR